MHQRKSQGKLKYIEINEKENTFKCNQNLLGSAKEVVRGKFIALNVTFEKRKSLKYSKLAHQ